MFFLTGFSSVLGCLRVLRVFSSVSGFFGFRVWRFLGFRVQGGGFGVWG